LGEHFAIAWRLEKTKTRVKKRGEGGYRLTNVRRPVKRKNFYYVTLRKPFISPISPRRKESIIGKEKRKDWPEVVQGAQKRGGESPAPNKSRGCSAITKV